MRAVFNVHVERTPANSTADVENFLAFFQFQHFDELPRCRNASSGNEVDAKNLFIPQNSIP